MPFTVFGEEVVVSANVNNVVYEGIPTVISVDATVKELIEQLKTLEAILSEYHK